MQKPNPLILLLCIQIQKAKNNTSVKDKQKNKKRHVNFMQQYFQQSVFSTGECQFFIATCLFAFQLRHRKLQNRCQLENVDFYPAADRVKTWIRSRAMI